MGILDASSAQWLVLAAVISALTTKLLGECGSIWASVWDSIRAYAFKVLAQKLDITEDWLKVQNVGQLTHILEQLGMCTYRYTWLHDANVDTANGIQFGTLKLPTVSWTLWLLSVLEIGYVIWIKNDGTNIHIIGPREATRGLMKVAKVCETGSPSSEELRRLQSLFGLDGVVSGWECNMLLVELGAGELCWTIMCIRAVSWGSVVFTMVGVLGGIWFLYRSVWQVKHQLLAHVRSRLKAFWESLQARRRATGWFCWTGSAGHSEVMTETVIDVPLLQGTVESHGDVPFRDPESSVATQHDTPDFAESEMSLVTQSVMSGDGSASGSGPRIAGDSELEQIFSFVTMQGNNFVVGRQQTISLSDSSGQTIDVEAPGLSKIYALAYQNDFITCVAKRIRTTAQMTYICVHNPTTDLHLMEMDKLIQQGGASSCLVVILPLLEFLEKDLSVSQGFAYGAHGEVRTIGQFMTWLEQHRLGAIRRMVMVVPYSMSLTEVEPNSLWTLIVRGFRTEVIAA